MKNKFLYSVILGATMMASCKKEFTERLALDAPSVPVFYETIEQIQSATGTLYGRPWFDFNDHALDGLEVLAGNAYSGDNTSAGFLTFSISSTDVRVSELWSSFYRVVGTSNILINTFEKKKAQGGDPKIYDLGIAEARFIRGTGVFYIARLFGDAPLVTDPGATAISGNFAIPRYQQKDLLRFAMEDLQFAEANLPETANKGRVTKNSAKGMMAKLYLYQKDYANAKAKAGEVIASGKYDLFPDYQGMFTKSVNNNNIESLFALQWAIFSYGTQNSIQAYRAPGNLLYTGDGWSSAIPSLDMLKSYEPDDKRRKWSVMEQGSFYPDWKVQPKSGSPKAIAYNQFMANGYIYDTGSTPELAANEMIAVRNGTRSNISKYVVGPGSGSEPVQKQTTVINTYILRYADVLLMYAEATLGDAASTSDQSALDAFNKVRARAGLPMLPSLTKDIILRERRSELAFEGDYWFDVQRQGFAKASQIIAGQERGTIDYTRPGGINSLKVQLALPYNQLYLPIPLNEVNANPELNKPPVPYYR